jgi:heme/copper-type cytochrome/quinol oxidase subunit 3
MSVRGGNGAATGAPISAARLPAPLDQRQPDGRRAGDARLGIWLFLASEAVLFLALFATYAALRIGSSQWPRGAEQLGVAFGAVNTFVLVLSSLTMLGAWWAARQGDRRRSRSALLSTAALGTLFVAIKAFEWWLELRAGGAPAASHFHALYYLLTGLHVAHVLGGLAVLGYLAGPGFAQATEVPQRFAGRVELAGIFWHFVDIAWLVMFGVLYLT